MSKIGPDHYRYLDEIGPEGVTIEPVKYIVAAETPHCYYVLRESQSYLLPGIDPENFWHGNYKKYRKRISKYPGGKKLCYPTHAEALNSYRIRKLRQIQHTQHSLERAKTALDEVVNRLKDNAPTGPHICEGGEYFKELNWGEW